MGIFLVVSAKVETGFSQFPEMIVEKLPPD